MKKKQKNRNRQDPALILRTEFAGQPACVLKMLSESNLLTTTVTTGVIAASSGINPGGILNFATRFAGFNEYRIIKARLIVRFFSVTNSGVLSIWSASNLDSAAPSSSDAEQAKALRVNFSANTKEINFDYVPHDPLEQSWTQMGTGFTCGHFKLYTDAANWGAPIAVTTIGNYQWEATVQLRGYS